MNWASNSQPDGGNVTLNSTAGSVKVTSKITASGALHSGNVDYSGLTGGLSGNISITGVGGVSVSAALEARGRTNGTITINSGNGTVTSGGGGTVGVLCRACCSWRGRGASDLDVFKGELVAGKGKCIGGRLGQVGRRRPTRARGYGIGKLLI